VNREEIGGRRSSPGGVINGDEAERNGVGRGGETANGFSQLERRGDKTSLDGHTRLALGRQHGREVVVAAQLSRARVASVRAAVERCWTLTSGPSTILNF
jgi:hypothetical protein